MGIFNQLTKSLTRSVLGGRATITMDGNTIDIRAIVQRRQQVYELGDQRQFLAAAPEISLDLASLPRRPARGDIIEILQAPNDADICRWKVSDDGEDTGSGMIRCPVTKA